MISKQFDDLLIAITGLQPCKFCKDGLVKYFPENINVFFVPVI